MTLLLTIARVNQCISNSDMRVSVQRGNTYISVDENFNKHILFNIEELGANISYTGVAEWYDSGKKVKTYDIISDSLSKSANKNFGFGEIVLELTEDISKAISKIKGTFPYLELHIVGFHKQLPMPFMACISNFTKTKPWYITADFEREYQINGFNLFFKTVEQADYMIGGMTSAVTILEKETLSKIVSSNANPHDIINYSSKIIQCASFRNNGIGPKSVAIFLPNNGTIDTNLWERNASQVMAFLPRMVMVNGKVWGPCQFPVNFQMLIDGWIPERNIFFKSVVYKNFSRKHRRIIFKNKKGKQLPTIMEMISFVFFGKVPGDCDYFGKEN